MSSFAPDLGDAVQPDGMLKDVSKIDWSFNPDDSIPFPSDNPSGSHSASSGGLSPAIVVTSVWCTTHLSKPSRHVLDKLEAAGSASSASAVNHKCKVIRALPNQHLHKNDVHVVSDDDSDDKSESRSLSPPPTKPASDDYESLQAMADTDNQVCSLPHCTISFSH